MKKVWMEFGLDLDWIDSVALSVITDLGMEWAGDKVKAPPPPVLTLMMMMMMMMMIDFIICIFTFQTRN